jgi:hypothetical protein
MNIQFYIDYERAMAIKWLGTSKIPLSSLKLIRLNLKKIKSIRKKYKP